MEKNSEDGVEGAGIEVRGAFELAIKPRRKDSITFPSPSKSS